ncbi:hypothetical protein Tco_0022978, partial [Tanacetum coccineum]
SVSHIVDLDLSKLSIVLRKANQILKKGPTVSIGDGKSTSIWYDSWSGNGALAKYISKRDIYDARFCNNATVADMIKDNE